MSTAMATPPPSHPTASLLDSAREGSQDAFAQLFAKLIPRLRWYIGLRLGHELRSRLEVEDVLQETLVVAWEGLAGFRDRGPGSLLRWTCTLAENRIRRAAQAQNALQREERRTVRGAPAKAALALLPDARTGPCTGASRVETRSRLGGAIARLSDEERTVLLGRVIDGRTWPELAQELGCSETSARSAAASPNGPIDKGFAETPTFTTVTGSGADLSTWLDLASAAHAQSLGAALESLPRPGSALRGLTREADEGLSWRGWVSLAYALAAVILSIKWLREPRRSASRLRLLGGAMLASFLCLDKTLPQSLGTYSLNGLGACLLACAAYGLTPWTGRWGRVALVFFALAAVRELLSTVLMWTSELLEPGDSMIARSALIHSGPRFALLLGMLSLVPITLTLGRQSRSFVPPVCWTAICLLSMGALTMGPRDFDVAHAAVMLHLITGWIIVLDAWRTMIARAGEDDAARSSSVP